MGLKELFEKITNNVSQEVPRSVENGILKAASNQINVKVPYCITDENTRKCIEKYKLYNPQKLVEYFVDVGFGSTETILKTINDIKGEMYIDLKGELKGTKRNIKLTLSENDSEQKIITLKSHIYELNKISAKFEEKAIANIKSVNSIDKMGGFERFTKAAFIEKNIDTYTKIAKACLEAVLEIFEVQLYIADYIGNKDYMNTICVEMNEFMKKEIYCHISTMNEWSLAEDRGFWSDKIRVEYDGIEKQHQGLLEMFDDMREQADLENIIFT